MAISKEEISNIQIRQLLAPTAINAGRNDIAAVDTSGFQSVTITVQIGESDIEPSNANNLQIRLAHSDNNHDFETCDASQIVTERGIKSTSTIIANLNTPASIDRAYGVGYIGHRRFVKPVIIANGNLGEGMQISITAILHNPKYRPTLRLAVNNPVQVPQIQGQIHAQPQIQAQIQPQLQGQGNEQLQQLQQMQAAQNAAQNIAQDQENIVIQEDHEQPLIQPQ